LEPLLPDRVPRRGGLWADHRIVVNPGLADLVDRCCDHARLIADRLAAEPGIDIINDVVLNQVLVRFGDDDALTHAVIEQLQRDRTCWLAGSTFRGRFVMRISIVGWQTTSDDVHRSAAAIITAVQQVRSRRPQ
jgi:glutamate/tyrosine decarboxylase-like PLP-dependent enzyme